MNYNFGMNFSVIKTDIIYEYWTSYAIFTEYKLYTVLNE